MLPSSEAAHRGPGFRVQNRRGLERKIFSCDCADPTTGMYAHTWSSPKGEATWREHSEVSLQTPDDHATAAEIIIDQWHPVQNREINQSMDQIAPSCMMNQSLHHRARETLGSRVMEGPWHPTEMLDRADRSTFGTEPVWVGRDIVLHLALCPLEDGLHCYCCSPAYR